MRERELRDRLADDRQERARALELDREGAAPLARAQRVRGANGEGCEPREHEIVGLALGLEEELERAERRLAELQGGERAAVAEPLDLDRPCLRLGALYRLQRDRGRGRARGAGEGRKHRPVRLVAPEQAGSGPRRLARERRNLICGPRLVGARRQRVAGELQQVRRGRAHAVAAAVGPSRKRDLVRCRARERALALVEGLLTAHQLERPDHVVRCANRQLQHRARAQLLGNAPERPRQLKELVPLLGRHGAGADPGAFELGPQRGRGRVHGARGQAACLVSEPGHDDVGSPPARRCAPRSPPALRRARRLRWYP